VLATLPNRARGRQGESTRFRRGIGLEHSGSHSCSTMIPLFVVSEFAFLFGMGCRRRVCVPLPALPSLSLFSARAAS